MKPILNITFSFDDAEDRVILRCKLNDQTLVALHLTRRLTGPLLESLAKLLLKTSDTAAPLPSQLQEEVIVMEHARALAQVAAQAHQAGAPNTAPEGAEAQLASHLLTRVDFQPRGGVCTLQFFCNGSDAALTAITFNRAQLHWFVDTLDRFAKRADWEIRPFQRAWLALRDAETANRNGTGLLH